MDLMKDLKQDLNAKKYGNAQLDKLFKVETNENHQICRIGNLEEFSPKHDQKYVNSKLQSLNNSGFMIDHFYNKNIIEYSEIIEAILTDSNFLIQIKSFVQNLNKGKILLKPKLQQLYVQIHNFIGRNCFRSISQLKMIILGMEGYEEFNTDTALVADEHFAYSFLELPFPIQNVVNHFDAINSSLGLTPNDEIYYDYHAINSKQQGFLFLNTCLSTDPEELINCLCTVEFVNRILVKAKECQNRLAVLDLRITSDYFDDIDRVVPVKQLDYHHLIQMDDPMYWDAGEAFDPNDSEILEQLTGLIENGYKINEIYLNKKFLKSRQNANIKKTQNIEQNNDCGEYDGQNCDEGQGNSPKFDDSNNSADNQAPTDSNNNNNENEAENFDDKNREQNNRNGGQTKNTNSNESTEEKTIVPSEETLRIMLTIAAKENWNVRLVDKLKHDFLHKRLNTIKYERSTIDRSLFRKIESENKNFTLIHFEGKMKQALKIVEKSNKQQSFEFEFLGIQIEFRKDRFYYFINQFSVIEEILKMNRSNIVEIKQKFREICSKTRPDLCATVNIINYYQLSDSKIEEILDNMLNYLKITKEYKLMLNPIDSFCGYSDGSDRNEKSKPTSDSRFKHKSVSIELENQDIEELTEILPESLEIEDDEQKPQYEDLYRSQIGFFIVLFKCSVVWNSTKEETLVKGNVFLELLAKQRIVEKIINLKELLKFIGLTSLYPTTVFVDYIDDIRKNRNNKSKQNLSPSDAEKERENNKQFNLLTKLILDPKTKKKHIQFQYITSNNNIADLLTKPVQCKLMDRKELTDNKDNLNMLGLFVDDQKHKTI